MTGDDAALSWLDERFRAFVSGLPGTGPGAKPVWFCFFSTGLLHVVRHFLRFIPADLNCALITSGMTPEEIAFRNGMTRLPAFDMAERVGSHEIFELVYRNLDRPFGLVDVDCFVADGDWFDECAAGLEDGVAINGAFCYGPIPLAAPPFMMIDPAAHAEVERAIGGPVSPAAYAYTRPGPGQREIDVAMVRYIEPHHEAALVRVLGMEAPHLPFPQGGLLDVLDDGREVRSHERFYHRQCGHRVARVVFDGMMLYQLVALSAGWRIEHFRRYPGTKVFSAEAVHAGGISYWERVAPSNLAEAPELPWSAHVDAVLLDAFVGQPGVPDAYGERGVRLAKILRQYELDVPQLRRQLRGELAGAGVDVANGPWAAVLDEEGSGAR